MFTGIVEAVGCVRRVEDVAGAKVVTFEAPQILKGLSPGGSVSVDGACLTVVRVSDDGFQTEIVGTTLSRTLAKHYKWGSRVNLERAMRLGDRLDGHWIQGHVDGLGRLIRIDEVGEYRLMDFEIPELVHDATVLHGSIAINGVSLTVNGLPGSGSCQVAIVPHTWQNTNLADLEPGDPANLEGDLIGKYVGRMLAARGGEAGKAAEKSANEPGEKESAHPSVERAGSEPAD